MSPSAKAQSMTVAHTKVCGYHVTQGKTRNCYLQIVKHVKRRIGGFGECDRSLIKEERAGALVASGPALRSVGG